MRDKQLILPIYIKLLLFIGDSFVLLALFFSLPLIMLLSIELENNINIGIINTIIPIIVLLSAGLIRSIKRIKIIEGSNSISRGNFSGEIGLPVLTKFSNQRLLLRLSLEIPNKNYEKKIIKHFYLVKSQLSYHHNDYLLIFNKDNPSLAILVNSLPGLVRIYISKWENILLREVTVAQLLKISKKRQ